jgi:hypothetical protein
MSAGIPAFELCLLTIAERYTLLSGMSPDEREELLDQEYYYLNEVQKDYVDKFGHP